MSTFKGIVKEFPQIRIDYFRRVEDEEPPLACFLSHVHSDHLQGLESLKSPFVYCSPATREILLRLEKFPHRMNFAKGILESRIQTYRHLKKILKTIPLETPTVIEIRPGYEIRVSLFDANHCVGAVMFLIEGQGNAILYTGDIRSETWWVNSLVQNPILLPYAGCVKRIDCMYLDTTFASKVDRYCRFPSKAEGLRELIEKVAQYPDDTIFYMEAWTFGYENVWIALASFLKCQTHLDRYRASLYKALASTSARAPGCHEAPQLCGFELGNHEQKGCLTTDPNVRLHSCERGTLCPIIDRKKNIVKILPIVSRLSDGAEVHEMGLGGGHGDLRQTHELELNGDAALLMQMCASKIENKGVLRDISRLLSSSPRINLGRDLDDRLLDNNVTLEDLVAMLSKISTGDQADSIMGEPQYMDRDDKASLPPTITFPYSRHSSYTELCCLVEAFKPRDVYPCTVDESSWSPDASMRTLFGHLCSSKVFAHDMTMMTIHEERDRTRHGVMGYSRDQVHSQDPIRANHETQQTDNLNNTSPQLPEPDNPGSSTERFFTPLGPAYSAGIRSSPPLVSHIDLTSSTIDASSFPKRARSDSPLGGKATTPRKRTTDIRKWAYMAAMGMDSNCNSWDAFGGLDCVGEETWKEKEM